MSAYRSYAAGSRLPSLVGADGRPVWRPQYTRNPVVLAVLHGADCESCTDYRRNLVAARPDFRAWDGRLVVAEPQPVDDMEADTATVTVPDTFGGAPRVIVADRFGDVYHVREGGPAHELPEPRALEEWLRFIATQCPE